MLITALSLSHAVIEPQWYTSLELIVSIVVLVVYELLIQMPKAFATKKDIDKVMKLHQEMRTLIETVGNQVKTTTTKLSATRLKFGLVD